jgi:hypothetical protein
MELNVVALLLGAFGLSVIVAIYYVWGRKPSQAESSEKPQTTV